MLEGSVYCSDCLVENQLTVADVEDALVEQHGLAEYLNQRDCPFVFKPVARDGFCLFRNLVEFAKECAEEEEQDALCRKIMDAAVDATEAARLQAGDDAVDQDALKALMEIKQNATITGAIKSRWLELDAEQIIRGFVSMFKHVAVKVCRWSPSSGWSEQIYPEERSACAERVLCMFHWQSLLHFDRLILKT